MNPKLDTLLQTHWEKRERLIFLALLLHPHQDSLGCGSPSHPPAGLSYFVGQEAERISSGVPDVEELLQKGEGSHKLALSFYSPRKL